MGEDSAISSVSNSEYEDLITKSLNLDKKKEKSIVEGKVIAIDNEAVVVDVGLKSEGRIPISEFSRPGQEAEIQIGDSLNVFIDQLDGINGETKLSRSSSICIYRHKLILTSRRGKHKSRCACCN